MARLARPRINPKDATPEQLESLIVYEVVTRLPEAADREVAPLLGKLQSVADRMRAARGADSDAHIDLAAQIDDLRAARRKRGA